MLSPVFRQRGASLFLALIAVVALSLAGVALIRSVNSGNLVIGNLGFKQDATRSSDRAAEVAIAWLAANLSGTTLQQDSTARGYYASSLDALDPTGRRSTVNTRALVDWDNNNCAYAPQGSFTACVRPLVLDAATLPGQNRHAYVITRLCPAAGSDSAQSCAKPPPGGAGGDSKRSGLDYSDYTRFSAGSSPYYRIVVRTVGARNTVSYSETIVRF